MPEFWSRFRHNRVGLGSALFIAALVLITVAGPLLTTVDPHAISGDVLRPPSMAHALGTDEVGRDVAQSLIYGVRVSLFVGIAAALAASIIGVFVGGWAGYFGGKVDFALMRITEIFQVLPAFVLAAVTIAMLGRGLTLVVLVISLLAWPQVALVMRGEVMRVKQLEFVDAARCLGYREAFILLVEVIPNAIRAVLAIATLIVGQAILIEASLGFLGLSNPELISWGRMLNSGQRYLMNAWWLSVLPGTAIFLTVLAFNLLGDVIDATLNPRDST
jgi:peptide/nickel transport system permease protein